MRRPADLLFSLLPSAWRMDSQAATGGEQKARLLLGAGLNDAQPLALVARHLDTRPKRNANSVKSNGILYMQIYLVYVFLSVCIICSELIPIICQS